MSEIDPKKLEQMKKDLTQADRDQKLLKEKSERAKRDLDRAARALKDAEENHRKAETLYNQLHNDYTQKESQISDLHRMLDTRK